MTGLSGAQPPADRPTTTRNVAVVVATGRNLAPSGHRWRLFSMPLRPPDCKRHDFRGRRWHSNGTTVACRHCGAIKRGERVPFVNSNSNEFIPANPSRVAPEGRSAVEDGGAP